MIKQSLFKPAWWLNNPHLQTMWPTISNRRVDLSLERERLILPDNDFLDLVWETTHLTNKTSPIIVLLHGLAGSIESKYAKGLLQAMAKQGWRAVLMHFRGCSGEPNYLDRSYHSGETSDIHYVIHTIHNRFPDAPIAAMGISLGGNVLLKWLGETAANKNPLVAAVAVSVPFELAKLANHMQTGFARFYQWYLIQKMLGDVRKKYRNRAAPIDLKQLDNINTFWCFDENITAPLHGFKDVNEYYELSSSRQYIKHIQTPTLIIHATDDPFMTPDVIPTENDLSPSVTLELSEKGGHAGFITGETLAKPNYWLEQRAPEFIANYFL